MKRTQAEHVWSRFDTIPTGCLSIETNADLGFAQSQVPLQSKVSVVAGLNGSGKTRLLRSLSGAGTSNEEQFASITWSEKSYDTHIYVDFFELLNRQFSMFAEKIEDLTESVDFAPLDNSLLAEANWVLGRKYHSVEIGEVENTQNSGSAHYRSDVVPYFRVSRSQGQVFGSEVLSRGELVCLTILWFIRTLDPKHAFFLDEPDLMLSPEASHRALTLLTNELDRRRCHALISTHSYHLLSRIPAEFIVFLGQDESRQVFAERPEAGSLWNRMQVDPPKKYVFIVEDAAAREVLRLILSLMQPELLQTSELWIAQGSGEVRKAAGFPIFPENAIRFIGVLDGDEVLQRATRQLMKLPGEKSPERVTLDAIDDHSADFLSDLPLARRKVVEYEHLDIHDQVQQLAKDLGHSNYLELIRSAWRWWMTQTEAGKQELEQFIGTIRRSLE